MISKDIHGNGLLVRGTLPFADSRKVRASPRKRQHIKAASAEGLGLREADSSIQGGQDASILSPPQTNAETMEEYAELKHQLFGRAQRAAGFLTLYIALQQGLVAGACTLAGGLTGFLYLTRIVKEADGFHVGSSVPIMKALDLEDGPIRQINMVLAGYRQAVRPRWLLPVLLAACVQVFNQTSEFQISTLQEFDMLLGFLCYKAGLFLALYDDIKPKFDPKKLDIPERPILSSVELSAEEERQREDVLRSRRRH